MQTLFRSMVAALAALFGFGLFAMTQATGASANDIAAKREDSANVVLADHDDDYDDDYNTRWTRDNHTNVSRMSRDATNSRFTRVSRDRDFSRRDLTRDWTRDGGGDLTRDHSRHHTNDSTRHDTR